MRESQAAAGSTEVAPVRPAWTARGHCLRTWQRGVLALGILSGLVATTVSLSGQAAVAPIRGFVRFKSPDGRFSLDHPAKDWRLVEGAGSTLVVVTHKDGLAIVLVDYQRLRLPAPADIDEVFVEVEVEIVKERTPGAKDVKTEIRAFGTGRAVVIRYTSPGLKGPERVVQYSIPRDNDLYRLVGRASEMATTKYEPVIRQMIESFTMAPSTSK
jgi:hypothetical protein